MGGKSLPANSSLVAQSQAPPYQQFLTSSVGKPDQPANKIDATV